MTATIKLMVQSGSSMMTLKVEAAGALGGLIYYLQQLDWPVPLGETRLYSDGPAAGTAPGRRAPGDLPGAADAFSDDSPVTEDHPVPDEARLDDPRPAEGRVDEYRLSLTDDCAPPASP